MVVCFPLRYTRPQMERGGTYTGQTTAQSHSVTLNALSDLKDACVVFLEGAELKHSAWVDTLTLCMETGSSNIVYL